MPGPPVSWNGAMESTAADAMPDDTALTPQASDTEPSPSADNPVMAVSYTHLTLPTNREV